MAFESIIAVPRLREILFYDLSTGGFRWLERKQGRRARVGSVKRDGIRIKIDYRGYQAHVLAWAWVTGEWPEGEIDHINNNPFDNRWSNLRPATRQQQTWNRSKRKGTLHKQFGIFRTAEGRWSARIQQEFLGNFDTADEAAAAYRQAAIERYGSYAHSSLLPDNGIVPKRRQRGIRADNTSGFPGVRQLPHGKWRARFSTKHLGCFDTPEEAHEAYLKAKSLARLRHRDSGSSED